MLRKFRNSVPEFCRGTADYPPELPVEVGYVAEAAVKGDLQNVLIAAAERLTRLVYPKMRDVFHCAQSHMVMKAIHKIAFAQVNRGGKLLYGDNIVVILCDIFKGGTDNAYRFAVIGVAFRLGFQQPEKTYKLTSQQHIQRGCVAHSARKNIARYFFKLAVIMMLGGNVSLYPHTSVYQRLYTLCDISVGVGAFENIAAEYDSIIHLSDVGTWINGVEHIRQGDDYISRLRCKFFLSADKLCRAFTDKAQLKLAVPVHGNAVEMIGNRTFVVAERLYIGRVYPIFL